MDPSQATALTEINWHLGFSAFQQAQPFPEGLMLPHSAPQLFSESARAAIVICLHGWTASPYEALPIARSVVQHGFAASVPCLPGHGIESLEMAKTVLPKITYRDWAQAVRQEITWAREHYHRVYIYGQSMGGALALLMAEEHLVEACATTAPAIDLGWATAALTRCLGWTNLFETKQETETFFNEGYPFRSVKSGAELRKLGEKVRKRLAEVTCPVLECHSELDQTIRPKVAHMIAEHVSGSIEVQWFNRSGHTMPLDIEAESVIASITQFFCDIEANFQKSPIE